MSANTTPRVITGANQDTTGRTITQDYQTPAYAASVALAPKSQLTTVKMGALTGVMTVTADVTIPFIGDEMNILFTGDSVDRVVTFTTGFTGLSTITVSGNGYALVKVVYNGVKWCYAGSGTLNSSDVQTPAYAATLSVTTTARSTRVLPAQLTGAMTINMVTTSAVAGDVLDFGFGADGTNRVVTFGTGLKTSGTLTITASKWGGIRFVYDGTQWIANGREITA